MNHKQKKIKVFSHSFEVDAKIASLIKNLNQCGYATELSCEDNNGTVWIMFHNYYATRLMKELCQYEHSLGKSDLFEYLSYDAKWTIVYEEESEEIGEDEVEGTGELCQYHSLRFPKEDLKKVEKMFNRFIRSSFYETLL